MKKTLLITVLVVGLAGTTAAQVPKPFSIWAGGGVSVPTSDSFSDQWNAGFNGMAAFSLNFTAVPGLKGMAKFQYHRVTRDSYITPDTQFANADQDLNIYMFGVDGLFRFGTPGGPFSPYSAAGIGLAHMNFSNLDGEGFDPVEFENETKFYFNIVAGIDIRATAGLDVFVQASYVNINTEGDAIGMVPITAGIKF